MTILIALLLLGAPTKEATKSKTIWGIRWYPSIESAQKAASKNKKKPKAILHMRVLGDLKGKT